MGKYENYCAFLASHFQVVTPKEEFEKNGTIRFDCLAHGHINELTAPSFSNKKMKFSVEMFCKKCKQLERHSEHTRKWGAEIFAKCGHIIDSVDWTTRKVVYRCGHCGSNRQSCVRNFLFENRSDRCKQCRPARFQVTYERALAQVQAMGMSMVTTPDDFHCRFQAVCRCGETFTTSLTALKINKGCDNCCSNPVEPTEVTDVAT